MSRCHVVTGGGRDIGRAIAKRRPADGDIVVAVNHSDTTLGWAAGHPVGRRIIALAGDASDEAVTGQRPAWPRCSHAGRSVNNAAVFTDARLDAGPRDRSPTSSWPASA